MKKWVYYVKWCDATSLEQAWLTVDEAIEWADNEKWEVESVGWILEENNKYILLCSKVGGDGQVGQLFKIPKTWILERKRLNQLKESTLR